MQSVLEREAAVQNDPTNAQAWFELGVKQQENEQEAKALIALQRAVDADPNHLPSWLALAVSRTNESDHRNAYKAIHEWVTRSSQEEYGSAIGEYQAKYAARNLSEDYTDLIECLISMARSCVSGQVDADVQIALAVLLNGNEVCYAHLLSMLD
jgi:peroxin-5